MKVASCDEILVGGRAALPVSPIAESMAVAVLGAEGFRNGNCLLDNPRIASAFLDDATVRTVELGAELWSAVRASADGSVQLLFVHNAADGARTFAPGQVLPVLPGAPIHFIRGEMQTRHAEVSESSGDVLCELPGHGFAWLARFPSEGH